MMLNLVNSGDVPETTGDFLNRLAHKSLEDHNANQKKEFEFVRVVKSNLHFSAGLMFLITFEVIDPYDGIIKPFQARVRYLNDTFTEYIFCKPKPNIEVKYYGKAKKNVAKKQRLESELLYKHSG